MQIHNRMICLAGRFGRCHLIPVILIMILLTIPEIHSANLDHEYNMRVASSDSLSTLLINEIYPDPNMDIDGDGNITQDDEFIELFNRGPTSIHLDGWTICDNYGSFGLDGLFILPGSHLLLPRTLTGLKLANNDIVILLDVNGSEVDSHIFEGISRGISLQRIPDGATRWSAVSEVTPGERNLLPPRFLINEIMVDPPGSNTHSQWVEIVNMGTVWNVDGFMITNHESFEIILPKIIVPEKGRMIIHTGSSEDLPPMPEGTICMTAEYDRTVYVSGDDLELLDMDGYTLDHVAWGSSSHVDMPTGLGPLGTWSGKYYDRNNETMSEEGEENPIIESGRSLLRIPDLIDTNSPGDLSSGPVIAGSTPGWNNSWDPDLTIGTDEELILIDEGKAAIAGFNLTRSGSMRGDVNITILARDQNWSISMMLKDNDTGFDDKNIISGFVNITAPADVRISRESLIDMVVTWEDLPFIDFSHSIKAMIPFFDGSLVEMDTTLGGLTTAVFPEGSFISVKGKLSCEGIIDGGDAICTAELSRGGDVVIFENVDLKNLKKTSTRSLEFTLDTFGLDGNHTLTVTFDPDNRIKEPDEDNNIWERDIEILPTVLGDDQADLMITRVLWNTSVENSGVTIFNTGSSNTSLFGLRISDGAGWFSFPEGSFIQSNESILIAFGESVHQRFDDIEKVYRCDGKGPLDQRMIKGGPGFDMRERGIIMLTTIYRDLIDSVILKRKLISETSHVDVIRSFPEATWNTMIIRRNNSRDEPLDTDSPMDWKTEFVTGSIELLSIDPGPGGPGEFVGITGPHEESDLSGLGLVRGSNMAVIPYGTKYHDRPVIIAQEPDLFRQFQMVEPDLAVSSDGDNDQASCRVPKWGSLNLPNNGGELVLVDNGNRFIMNISWGIGTSIEKIKRGGVIGKSGSMNDPSRWKLIGDSQLPLFRINGEGEDLRYSIHMEDLLDSFEDKGSDRVTAIVPGLTDDGLASILARIRKSGTFMDIYMTTPPWSRDDRLRIDIGNDMEMGYIDYLAKAGARIFVPDRPQEDWGFATLISSSSIWNLEVSRNRSDEVNIHRISCSGISSSNGTLGRWKETFLSMLDQHDWFDPGPVLDEVIAIEPRSIGIDPVSGNDPHISLQGGAFLQWSVDPSTYVGQTKELRIVHSNGPLDVETIMEMAKAGTRIEIEISSHLLKVEDSSALSLLDSFLSSSYVQSRKLDWDRLMDDMMIGVGALVDISCRQNIDIDVKLLGEEAADGSTFNRWYWDGGSAFQTGYDLRLGLAAWVIVPESRMIYETGLVSGRLSKVFPRHLIPSSGETNINGTGPKIRIDRIYYDTYLKNDPDEALRIINTGKESMDLSGFIITDDEGSGRRSDGILILPQGSSIGPGEHLWIARDGGYFEFQFGFSPDLCIFNTTGCPLVKMVGGDLRLANSNDTVSLRDPSGIIVDVVPYGGAQWSNVWKHFDSGGWYGPSAPSSGWGRILYRWKLWGDSFPEDTNTDLDWISPKTMYPGQSEIEPKAPVHVEAIQGGITPDSGSDLLGEAISDSSDRILMNVYQMTSQWIVSTLISASERGIDVKVILEGGPVGGTSYTGEVLADRLTRAGIEVRWMMNVIAHDIRDRYRFNHAKYLVIDGQVSLISTDNFKDSSFPGTLSGGGGTRGWIVSVESSEISSYLEDLFMEDWNGPDMILHHIEETRNDKLSSVVHEGIVGKHPPRFSRSDRISGAEVQPLFCPDHISVPGNPLHSALMDANSSIDIELMDISTSFSLQHKDRMEDIKSRWGISTEDMPFENPYLNVLFKKAREGVDIRLLIDGSDFDGDGTPENYHTYNQIEKEIHNRNLKGRFVVKIHPSPVRDYRGEISLIHNKGAIIDGNMVWISSYNWGPTSAFENREVGLLIKSDEIGSYYTHCFLNDWGNTIHNELDHSLRYAIFEELDDGNILSRISLIIDWKGDEDLHLSLVGMDDEEMISDIATLTGPFDGETSVNATIHDFTLGDHVVLRASTKGRSTDLCPLIISSYKDEKTLSDPDPWRSGLEPVFIIIGIVLVVALVRSTIIMFKEKTKTLNRGGIEE